jgi:hypothetical protein
MTPTIIDRLEEDYQMLSTSFEAYRQDIDAYQAMYERRTAVGSGSMGSKGRSQQQQQQAQSYRRPEVNYLVRCLKPWRDIITALSLDTR